MAGWALLALCPAPDAILEDEFPPAVLNRHSWVITGRSCRHALQRDFPVRSAHEVAAPGEAERPNPGPMPPDHCGEYERCKMNPQDRCKDESHLSCW